MKSVFDLLVPTYKPQSPRTITRGVHNEYKIVRKQIKEKLTSIKHIALSSDLWKNRRRQHFLSLTGHFLNDNFEYISILISFKRFYGRHLSVAISPFLKKELEKLAIDRDKIVGATSDNGSNIKATFKEGFGIWFSCICHNFNLILKPFFKQQKTIENETEIQNRLDTSDEESEVEEEDVSEEEASEEEYNDEDTDEETDEEDDKTNEEDIIKVIMELITKIRKLIKAITNNQIVNEYFIQLGNQKQLFLDFHVRWNSTFLMLKRFKELKEQVSKVTYSAHLIKGLTKNQINSLKDLEIKYNEWDIVDILIDVFTPFYEGTVMLSGSRYPTLSTAYFVTRCLFTYLERNEDDDSEIKLQLKSFLLERSKHHLKEKYSNDQKDAMLIAAFLDSVCFAILNELEIEKAIKLILKKQN